MDKKLKKKINKHASLAHYPKASRNASLVLNSLWNGLAGGGTVLGLITIVSAATVSIIAALGIGVILYGFNASYNFYLENKKEAAATKKLDDEFEKLKVLINNDILAQIKLIKSCVLFLEFEDTKSYTAYQIKMREEDIRAIYTHLHELKLIIEFYVVRLLSVIYLAKENHDNETIREKKSEINKINKTIATIDKWSNKIIQLYGPDRVIEIKYENLMHLPSYKKDKNTEKFKNVLKNIGNNFTIFLGGASMVIGLNITVFHLLGIAFSLGFLVSSPAGWATIGLMVIGGIAAITLNYVISEHRKKRLKRLNSSMEKISAFVKTIKYINTSVKSIYKHTNLYQRYNEEDIKKKKLKAQLNVVKIQNKILLHQIELDKHEIDLEKNKLQMERQTLEEIEEMEENLDIINHKQKYDFFQEENIEDEKSKSFSTKDILLELEEEHPATENVTKKAPDIVDEPEVELNIPRLRNRLEEIKETESKEEQTTEENESELTGFLEGYDFYEDESVYESADEGADESAAQSISSSYAR